MGIARAAAFLAALLCGAAALTLLRERTWPRGAAIALVLAVGVLLAAPSTLLQLGPARLDRAVVLHERLDLPDRAERRSAARRREPLRPRLPRVGARALLHARRERVRARARARGGAAPLRLLPRRAAERGRLAAPARRRSTTTGCSCCCARWRRSPRRSRSARRWLAAGDRRAAGVQPDRGPLGVVRPERRRRASCSWCWPSRSSRARASAGRRRSLAGAVLLKQFALVALPFLALMAVQAGADRDQLRRAALAFGGVVAGRGAARS